MKVENGKIVNKQKNTEGNFNCYDLNLTTLENCPEYVGGEFTCCNNNLTTLKGCPQHIGDICDASDNKDLEDISDLAPDCGEIFLVGCDKVKTFTTCKIGDDDEIWFRVDKQQQETLIQRIKEWPYYEFKSLDFYPDISPYSFLTMRVKQDNEVFMETL